MAQNLPALVQHIHIQVLHIHRAGGREGGREGRREGGRKRGRETGREGEREEMEGFRGEEVYLSSSYQIDVFDPQQTL